jgi:colanic acid/amylovoran/stewartan biosynthesis glycosyltransferase WcaL/AmsK/CpsK
VNPRVALFSTNFLAYSQTFVYEEIRCHRRYDVEVFCKRRLLAERFPFEPVHVGGPIYGATCRSAAFDARFRKQPFSLVHAHFGPGAVYALPFARRHRLPLVVTFHGYDVPLLLSPRRWLPQHLRYAIMGPRVLAEMTFGLCASEELQSLLLTRGVPSERLKVHRLGVDVDAFAPGVRDEHSFTVVMIGRFVEKKGFEYGIRAFAEAARAHPEMRLTIVGDGVLERVLKTLVRQEGMEARVTFTGPLAPDRVAALLGTSHVLLAPSVVDREGNRESGLMVVKEASAGGTVPIGTIHGGIPEIIEDSVTGFLVPERDVTSLTDRLLRLAGDPSLRAALAAAGRAKMAREYDKRVRVAALEALYDEARA